MFFCKFLQNNKYIPVAVPGEIEKQFPQRFVYGNPAHFPVFGFLGRYCYEIVFQVDVLTLTHSRLWISAFLMPVLTRTSHQQSTAMPNLPMPAASGSFTRFDVLSSTPPVASVAFLASIDIFGISLRFLARNVGLAPLKSCVLKEFVHLPRAIPSRYGTRYVPVIPLLPNPGLWFSKSAHAIWRPF